MVFGVLCQHLLARTLSKLIYNLRTVTQMDEGRDDSPETQECGNRIQVSVVVLPLLESPHY